MNVSSTALPLNCDRLTSWPVESRSVKSGAGAVGHARHERLAVVLVRQRLRGRGHFEELAQRLPAIRYLPHEQALGRHRLFDSLVEGEHPGDQLLGRLMAGGERRPRAPEQAVD